MAHRARCLKDEPGTLQFEVLVPREDETQLLLHEVYQDDDAFDTHRGGSSIAQGRAESAAMVAKVLVTRCTLVELSYDELSPAPYESRSGQHDHR